MMIYRSIMTISLLLILWPISLLAKGDFPEEYQDAKALIEKNCVTCFGNSQDKYEEGVKRLVELVDSGEISSPDALKLLGKAYGGLAFGYYEENSDERARYQKLQIETFRRLTKLACFDPSAQLLFAISLSGKERLDALKPVFDLRPILFEAKYIEAMEFLAVGSKDSGLKSLKLAAELATDRELTISRATRMAQEFRRLGEVKQADLLMLRARNRH